jgi:hypothetical protein
MSDQPQYLLLSFLVPVQRDVCLPSIDQILEMNPAKLAQVFEGQPSDAVGKNLIESVRREIQKHE